jgi:hypothetical protein
MHCSTRHLLKHLVLVPLLSASALTGSAVAQEKPIRLDSSDWWSYLRQEELPPSKPSKPVRFQPRELPEKNFQIGGITLPEPGDFSDIRSTFGDATEVERGDAASGRNQICYTSISGRMHLIFEFGEVDSLLYLFAGGPTWNGSEVCQASHRVSGKLSTVSGLRLGLAPQEVKNILGEPSVATSERLVYCFSFRKKSTPKQLAELRKNYPDMSEKEFIENFEYADSDAYVEARFVSGKLNYLAISKSETY